MKATYLSFALAAAVALHSGTAQAAGFTGGGSAGFGAGSAGGTGFSGPAGLSMGGSYGSTSGFSYGNTYGGSYGNFPDGGGFRSFVTNVPGYGVATPYGLGYGNNGSYGNGNLGTPAPFGIDNSTGPYGGGSYGNGNPYGAGSYGNGTPYGLGGNPGGGANRSFNSGGNRSSGGSVQLPSGGGYGMKPSRGRTGASYSSGGSSRDVPRRNDAVGVRPTPSDVGDFLGFPPSAKFPAGNSAVQQPKKYKPLTFPGNANGAAPNSGNAAVNKGNAAAVNKVPARPRPEFPGQISTLPARNPNANTRPVDVSKITPVTPLPSKQPSWAASTSARPAQVNDRWQNQVNKLQNWTKDNPDRERHWQDWGNDVRRRWRWHDHHHDWYSGDWWYHHHHSVGPWHYYYQFNYYPWSYWWTYPTWTTVGTWFTVNVPPIYYDYGLGGNVVYQGNNVLMDGQQIATAADFAQSAAALAAFTPAAGADPADAEWLPLGTFAVSTNESDINPTRTLQLAVDRSGVVAGTLYNIQTDQAQSVQGRVDQKTQRVAFQFSDAPNVIAETGLYNLTQDAAPMLVHYGTERVEVFNLIRLAAPEEDK